MASKTAKQAGSGQSGAATPDVSGDLSRIASYLTETRAATSSRTRHLVDDIAHRRGDNAGRVAEEADLAAPAQAQGPHDAPSDHQVIKRSKVEPLATNPLLAERYHIFCRDLDQMLDSFRARIEYKKSVKH